MRQCGDGIVSRVDSSHNPAQPIPLMVKCDGIPPILKLHDNWVLWKSEERNGNLTKVPYCISDAGKRASPTNPDTWGRFEELIQSIKLLDDTWGIGFVLSEDLGLIFLDFDHCRDPETEEIDSEILTDLEYLNTYAEVSVSGTGIHALCWGKIPGDRNRTANREMYSKGRYFTVTGRKLQQFSEEIREVNLSPLYQRWFPEEIYPKVTNFSNESLNDEQIIEICNKARNAHLFKQLWAGDISQYEKDDSRADQALCDILAFYSKDLTQIDRIFRRSKLYRDKWDRQDYRERTILKAIGRVTESVSHVQRVESDAELLTDLWNAQRFAQEHKGSVKYCEFTGKWYIWNGQFWEIDQTRKIIELAKDTARGIFREASSERDIKRSNELGKHAMHSQSNRALQDMVNLAKSESGIAIRVEEFDRDGSLLNLSNGVVNLNTITFREHRKDDLLSKTTGIEFIPESKCPLWLNHLDLVLNHDKELIESFQMMLGYSLLSTNPDQVFFLMIGGGANGKSVTLKIVSEIMGDYAKGVDPKSLMIKKGEGPRSDIARLFDARAIFSGEGEIGARLSEALIKQLTGADKIVARCLYKDEFEFTPGMKIWFCTNHLPEIWGTDHAIWRRMRVIPFDVTIPQERRDPEMSDKFRAEMSGILNWMLEGLRKYRELGYLPVSKRVHHATEQYRENMDILAPFIRDLCKLEPAALVDRKTLHERYCAYCNENGDTPLGNKTFATKLQEKGIISGTNSGTRRWQGIRLLNSGELAERDQSQQTVPHK